MFSAILCVVWIGLCVSLSCATFDLNIHELQMVADHLESSECRRLFESLHSDSWQLDHQMTGDSEPDLPCLDLLLRWDEREGRGKSFHDLAHRLAQIGRPDLGERLSRIVNHEKAEAVRKTLLRDPFKDMINRDSPILEEAPKSVPSVAGNPGDNAPRRMTQYLTLLPYVFLLLFAAPVVLFGIYRLLPWKIRCLEQCNIACKVAIMQHLFGQKPSRKNPDMDLLI